MAKPGTPQRTQQPLAVRSLADMHSLLQVPGHRDSSTHQPEVPLGALHVIDTGSATSAIEDADGNVHITIQSTPAEHPAILKDTTMTITTATSAAQQQATAGAGTAGYAAEARGGYQPLNDRTNVVQTPAPTTQGETVHVDTNAPTTVTVTPAAPAAEAPRRARRLFSAAPVGNFAEDYQASLGLEAQTAAIRQRLAHHDQVLARHDGEIDDLQHDSRDHADRIKKLEDRKPDTKTIELSPLDAGLTGLAVGAGVFAGVAAIGIAADWLFDTNLVTAPSPTN